jgi:hypothetical protein
LLEGCAGEICAPELLEGCADAGAESLLQFPSTGSAFCVVFIGALAVMFGMSDGENGISSVVKQSDVSGCRPGIRGVLVACNVVDGADDVDHIENALGHGTVGARGLTYLVHFSNPN